MSFWEGSGWQESNERYKAELAQITAEVRRDNPQLRPEHVGRVALRLYQERHPPPAPRCCLCATPVRAEWCSGHNDPYVCACACHQVSKAAPAKTEEK